MAATLSHHDGFYYGEHTGEFIEIQALRIHITYAGEGDPVLLIHGAGQNSYTWRHQFEALAERYGNLYLLGRLAEYKYYNMDAIVARALELCDTLAEKGA